MRRILVVSLLLCIGCASTKQEAKADLFKVTLIDGPPESGLEICIFPEAGAEVKCIKYETFLAAQKQRASGN